MAATRHRDRDDTLRAWPVLAVLCGVACAAARADGLRIPEINLEIEGLADLRVVVPSNEMSYLDGGLGKLRWGTSEPHPALGPQVGGMYLRGILGITPELVAVADIRADTQQQNPFDVIDAFVRWRPVSTSPWRWSVKAGAFEVPVSLENTGIGWTSEWTLTPSAINSWIGDELRTIGTEASLEWRGDVDHLQILGSAFAWNQPAGVAMAERGWTFDDHPTALFDRLRLPNIVQQQLTRPGNPVARRFALEFDQINSSPGWYAGVSWERTDLGRLALLRYDNLANPATFDRQFAWRTKFWSLGYSTDIPTPLGDIVLLAQGMIGSTVITPRGTPSTTDFYGFYALVGLERGDWRYALRVDRFGTDEDFPKPTLHEHGASGTAAVTWAPMKWLHVVGEVLVADYWRNQRTLEGLPPHAVETQVQVAVRLSF